MDAQFFENLRKMFTFERETGIISTFKKNILAQFDKIPQNVRLGDAKLSVWP